MEIDLKTLYQVQEDNMRDHNFGHEMDGVSEETATDIGFHAVDQVVDMIPPHASMSEEELIAEHEYITDDDLPDEELPDNHSQRVDDPELDALWRQTVELRAAELAAEKAARPAMPLSPEEQTANERKAITKHNQLTVKQVHDPHNT
jgi:hypothetical protein